MTRVVMVASDGHALFLDKVQAGVTALACVLAIALAAAGLLALPHRGGNTPRMEILFAQVSHPSIRIIKGSSGTILFHFEDRNH